MKNFFKSIGEYISPDVIQKIVRLIKFLLIYTVCFIILAMGFRYAIPFVIALLLALALKPIKNKILSINKRLKKLKISNGFVSFMITILIVAIFGLLLLAIGYKIIEQMKNYLVYVTNEENINHLIHSIEYYFNSAINSMNKIDPSIVQKIQQGIQHIIGTISSVLAVFIQNLLNIVGSIPVAFIMVFITIISTFFFIKDIDEIEKRIKGFFSPKGLGVVRKVKQKLNMVFGGYVKAYTIILLSIFAVSFVIFRIAKVEYALPISIITAILDALPLFGAGLVYGALALIMLFTGKITSMVILIVGYIGAAILRQFLEQKLVSSFLGVHPLVIIIALFLALTPLGFKGMVYFLGACIMYQVVNPADDKKIEEEIQIVEEEEKK